MYRTEQYSTVQYNELGRAARYYLRQYGPMYYTSKYTLYNTQSKRWTVQYSTVQYTTIMYSTVQYNELESPYSRPLDLLRPWNLQQMQIQQVSGTVQ